MSETRYWRVATAITAGTLGCGLPLWPIPYSEIALLTNPGAVLWLLAGSVAGVIAAAVLRPGVWKPVSCVMAGFALAVLGRVAVEIIGDPTLHNLWPLEVAIAALVGLTGGFIGVIAVRVGERMTGTR